MKAGTCGLSISVLPKSIKNIPEFILDKQNSLPTGSHKSKVPGVVYFTGKQADF